MEQKEINQRIAHSMLEQCGLVWENNIFANGPKDPKGEFTLRDVIEGLEDKSVNEPHSKTGPLLMEYGYDEAYKKKVLAIDGVSDFNYTEVQGDVSLVIPTSDTNPHVGFECSYPISTIFWLAKKYCKSVGCLAMMKKAIFGYDDNGPYSLIPKLKTTKARKARKPSKPKAKPVVINPATARAKRLRAALIKLHHAA